MEEAPSQPPEQVGKKIEMYASARGGIVILYLQKMSTRVRFGCIYGDNQNFLHT